ncbi:hypothetical protein [Jatrophihabitans sp.]|uniref:hypothetical protein n=1 Tax=Jatrophihabitans sp. TaxID=1932789 RepID=UPI0030C74F43|nr:hypothetical protein [Jatrophihabitans sp.]
MVRGAELLGAAEVLAAERAAELDFAGAEVLGVALAEVAAVVGAVIGLLRGRSEL